MRDALAPVARQAGIAFQRHSTTLAHVPKGTAKVVFAVRDPVSRFVSGFNSRLRRGQPRNNIDWNEGERWAFERFATPDDLGRALTLDRDNAVKAMDLIGHVRHPLTDWLADPGYLRERHDDILHICDQPTLNADFERIKSLLSLPAELALPSDPVRAHATPPGMSTKLSSLAEENIRDWYSRDIELYQACLTLRDELLAKTEPA